MCESSYLNLIVRYYLYIFVSCILISCVLLEDSLETMKISTFKVKDELFEIKNLRRLVTHQQINSSDGPTSDNAITTNCTTKPRYLCPLECVQLVYTKEAHMTLDLFLIFHTYR